MNDPGENNFSKTHNLVAKKKNYIQNCENEVKNSNQILNKIPRFSSIDHEDYLKDRLINLIDLNHDVSNIKLRTISEEKKKKKSEYLEKLIDKVKSKMESHNENK